MQADLAWDQKVYRDVSIGQQRLKQLRTIAKKYAWSVSRLLRTNTSRLLTDLKTQKRIQKCINFCARVLSGKRKYDHISGTLKSLGWLPAGQLHQYYTVMALRRLTDSAEPEALAALFVRNREVHTRTTRARDQFHLPRIRSEFGRKRFAYRSFVDRSLVNALPPHVRDGHESRKAFGAALKRHMLAST